MARLGVVTAEPDGIATVTIPGIGRGRFLLPTTDGKVIEAKVQGRFLDPYRHAAARDGRDRRPPGRTGRCVGILANFFIIRGVRSTAVRVLLMLGVLVATYLLWMVVAIAVGYALS
jgi:hypothetical protein